MTQYEIDFTYGLEPYASMGFLPNLESIDHIRKYVSGGFLRIRTDVFLALQKRAVNRPPK
jgi:hypothetical protein